MGDKERQALTHRLGESGGEGEMGSRGVFVEWGVCWCEISCGCSATAAASQREGLPGLGGPS